MSNGHFDFVCMEGKIKPYDVLASSTACWSESRMLAIGICRLNPMEPLDTRMSIGNLTRPVDPMDKWNPQWTFRLGLHGEENVISHDVMASSIAC